MSYDEEYYQKYYQKNKKKHYTSVLKWQRNNKDKVKKWNKKYKTSHKEKCQEITKNWIRNHKERFNELMMKGYKKNKLKWSARRKAVRKTNIPEGCKCQECKKNLATQRHHDDYSKPLEVKFLCRKCHRQITDKNKYTSDIST